MAFRTGEASVETQTIVTPTSSPDGGIQKTTTTQIGEFLGAPGGNAVAVAAWAASLAAASVGGYAVGKEKKGWGKWVLLALGGLAPGGLAIALGAGAIGYYKRKG
tara:strand:+ start:3109 stop:3423 length:315 start_codon:yes stop_codon:yes gene_type:complete